jgi:hypothetical protein
MFGKYFEVAGAALPVMLLNIERYVDALPVFSFNGTSDSAVAFLKLWTV